MNKTGNDLHSALSVFTDNLMPADYISAKAQAQISSSLVKYRIQNHLNQKEFADLLGVSQGLVSRWESSDYNFTIEKLADIAARLNMDLNISLNVPVKQDTIGPSIVTKSTDKPPFLYGGWSTSNNSFIVKIPEVV